MKKSNLFLIIGVFVSITLVSQSDLENHKKYWYYKSRLNNDFIKIGNSSSTGSNNPDSPDHGESMPLGERRFEDNSQAYVGNSNVIQIGDAGARLGIYVSVLATEYRILKNNGQNVDKVKHELFCALNAINRIDYYAESIFSNGSMQPSLNGFFMRDDIPRDFIRKNYLHFNYYNNGKN